MYGRWSIYDDGDDENDENDEYDVDYEISTYDDLSTEEFVEVSADYDDASDYTPLFFAVHEGDWNRFTALLDESDLEKKIHERTLMHVAAARGHAQIVVLLCQRNVPLISRKDGHGNTPLHLAVEKNHLEVFNLLLEESDLNASNLCDTRPLHLAASGNHIQFSEMLIKNGANVNVNDKDGLSPLFLALVRNHVELAEILLRNGADVNAAELKGKTPLHLATEMKNTHLIEIILEKGARVNVLDEEKYMTPTQIAAELNDNKLVEMFLKHGAKVDPIVEVYKKRNYVFNSRTPLHYAVNNRNLEMVELLMENGFNTLEIKNIDETPLVLAVMKNHLDVVKYLIKKGSKIEAGAAYPYCLLDLCKTNEHIEVLKYLIDIGVKCDEYCKHDIFIHIILNGASKIWEYILTRMSKINAQLSSIETKLHSAVRAGQIEILKEIINKPSTSSIKYDSLSSRLAVYIAVENGNEEIDTSQIVVGEINWLRELTIEILSVNRVRLLGWRELKGLIVSALSIKVDSVNKR